MKAVVIAERGKAEVQDVTLPKLPADRVLVKVSAVALNPTDWKHIHFEGTKGPIVGCDVVGTVEEVGDKVQTKVQKGDRVSGFCHGGNGSDHFSGCFAEQAFIKDGIFLKVPKNLSDAEASTLGVGVTTVGQAMYQSLGLPLPSEPAKTPFPVLIYGGSTATGTLAIQYAKLSNLQVITTCSPRNFDLVKSLGADAVFDYNDPACAEQIRDYTKNGLHHVLDCIALQPTAAICHAALSTDSTQKSYYNSLLPVRKFPREDVENKSTMAYTAFGEGYHKFGSDKSALPEDYEYAKKFWTLSQKLFEEGKLKVHRPEVRTGGLQGVLEGLDDLKNDRVSGVKLVYPLA